MTDETFINVVEGMMGTLYRVCSTQLQSTADREDAVQEALRRAWEKRHKLREERYAQTWIIRILLNECDRLRKKNARMQPTADVERQDTAAEESELRRSILCLEDELRIPVLLHYIEGYSVAETARIMRIPEGTVKSRLSRGRNKLRMMLKDEVFEE